MNEVTQDKSTPAPMQNVCCGEPTAKEVAERQMLTLSERVRDLSIVLGMLPTQMTYEQDRAVRNLLVRQRL